MHVQRLSNTHSPKKINNSYFSTTYDIKESGRSMIEMLGVLAVMGILSVVGVKVYTYTMNKHRANELINEANKRAVVVASQIMAGRSGNSLSISEFQNPTGHTFRVEPNPKNANQFNITITGVNSDICTQMKTMVGTDTAIRLISQFCDQITYNNNLSTTTYASDIQSASECTNAGNTWCGGSGVCSDIGCCDGQAELPPCQTCNAGAIVSAPMEGKACDYDGNGTQGMCHVGKCDPLPLNVSCDNEGNCSCTNGGQLCNRATDLCCSSTEMCSTSGDVNTTDTTKEAKCLTLAAQGSECTTNADCTDLTKPWCKITTTGNECDAIPTKGTCVALGNHLSATIYGLGDIIISSNGMNWWSAKNWCQAQGKHLINVEDLQVYKNGTTLLKTGAKNGSYACAKGKTCHRWDRGTYSVIWNGNTLTGAKDENGELYSNRFSSVVLSLAEHFKGTNGNLWTNSDYNSDDSCMAYYIYLSDGLIHYYSRQRTNFFALCH